MEQDESINPLLDTGDAARRFREDLQRMWEWAACPDPSTSQKLHRIDPEMAKRWKELKAKGMRDAEIIGTLTQIKAQLNEERQERKKNDPWKFVRNVAKYIVGEIDKR